MTALETIQEELKSAFIHVTSNDWLTKLFTLRKIDTASACDYITQSPFRVGESWDLPKQLVKEVDWEDREEESVYHEYFHYDEYDEEDDERDEGDAVRSRDWESVAKGRPVDDYQEDNDRLVQRFADIFNDVLDYFGLRTKRYSLGTDSTDDEYDDVNFDYRYYGTPKLSTRPDLVVLGEDERYLPRKLASYNRGMSVDQEDRRDLYRGCVAIGKVQKVQRRGEKDRTLEKLANCAREAFMYQPGRRFVYAFSLSPDGFQVFYFDRSGVVHSRLLDLNKEAVTLVQFIHMLGDPDLGSLGFDPTLYWEKDRQYVDVVTKLPYPSINFGTTKYEIDRILMHRPSLFQSGTLCWVIKKVGEETKVLMKDSWRGEEELPESDTLSLLAERNIPGLPRLLHTDASEMDRRLMISTLRAGQCIAGGEHKERVFSRIILELRGPSIRHCQTGLQMLRALRDVISAHQQLVKSDILHRDICPDNILLGEEGAPPGQRGFLVDFGKASVCERGKVPADKDVLTGTFLFRSANNLYAACKRELPQHHRKRHDFVDDLEAFFWVYTWLTMACNGSGNDSTFEPCGLVDWWEKLREPYPLVTSKTNYMSRWTNCGVESSPMCSLPPYVKLRQDLRDFLHKYRMKKEFTKSGELDLFPELDAIYETCLSYFDVAIAQLEGGPHLYPSLDALPPSPGPHFSSCSSCSSISSISSAHIPTAVTLPIRRIQPPRRAKRQLEDDNATSEPKTKKRKIAAPSLGGRPPLASPNRPRNAKPQVPRPIVGSHWSGRLRPRDSEVVATQGKSVLGKRQSDSQGGSKMTTKRRKARK